MHAPRLSPLFKPRHPLTCVVLVGGADKIDQFIGARSSGGKTPAKKDEIRRSRFSSTRMM